MSYKGASSFKKSFYKYAVKNGIPKECLLRRGNLDRYVDASADAFAVYPLHVHSFKGEVNRRLFAHILRVDYMSRLSVMAGIADSDRYRSVIMIEEPNAKKPSMIDYIKGSRPGDLPIFLRPVTHRMDVFERYALEKRDVYMDSRTIYLYVFATRKKQQGHSYGKKVIEVLTGFADKYGYRICLETNKRSNVGLYEHFGFSLKDESLYQGTLEHFVLVYDHIPYF